MVYSYNRTHEEHRLGLLPSRSDPLHNVLIVLALRQNIVYRTLSAFSSLFRYFLWLFVFLLFYVGGDS